MTVESTVVVDFLSQKLDYVNGCRYVSRCAKLQGHADMDFPTTTPYNVPDEKAPTRTWTIDGVSVQEIPEEVPSWMETPQYTPVKLKATIDGWIGQFAFKGGEDPTVKAAAEMLVNMIRTLKN